MKKKRVFDNEEVTVWKVEEMSEEEQKELMSEEQKELTSKRVICALSEDNLLYLFISARANPVLFPVELLKLFITRKVSTGEFCTKLVLQQHLEDDAPEGTLPHKQVVTLEPAGKKSGDHYKGSALLIFAKLKEDGYIKDYVTTDFSHCKTLDDVLKVWGIPDSVLKEEEDASKTHDS